MVLKIGIHMVGIWNSEDWNPETNTSVDSLTWSEFNFGEELHLATSYKALEDEKCVWR